jgi:hypothetical protein
VCPCFSQRWLHVRAALATGEGGEAARHACGAAAMVLVRAVRREMAQRWEDDDGGELDSSAMAVGKPRLPSMSTGDWLGSIDDDGCGSGAVGAAASEEGPRGTGRGARGGAGGRSTTQGRRRAVQQ